MNFINSITRDNVLFVVVCGHDIVLLPLWPLPAVTVQTGNLGQAWQGCRQPEKPRPKRTSSMSLTACHVPETGRIAVKSFTTA